MAERERTAGWRPRTVAGRGLVKGRAGFVDSSRAAERLVRYSPKARGAGGGIPPATQSSPEEPALVVMFHVEHPGLAARTFHVEQRPAQPGRRGGMDPVDPKRRGRGLFGRRRHEHAAEEQMDEPTTV